MIPEKVPTRIPLGKLNSLIDSRFFSSGISRSLFIPASPAMAIPSRQTSTPSRIIWPEAVPRVRPMVPLKIGGTSVPKAAQYPRAIAIPSDIPK